MKKLDLGQAIAILANIGVIAGIVFLGFELQQNNELLRAEARADRRDINREAVIRGLENPDLRTARLKAPNGEPLSDSELYILELDTQAALTDWQYIYLEYLQGLLDPETIPASAWRSLFDAGRDGASGMRAYWERNKTGFNPAFVQWVEAGFPEL